MPSLPTCPHNTPAVITELDTEGRCVDWLSNALMHSPEPRRVLVFSSDNVYLGGRIRRLLAVRHPQLDHGRRMSTWLEGYYLFEGKTGVAVWPIHTSSQIDQNADVTDVLVCVPQLFYPGDRGRIDGMVARYNEARQSIICECEA